MAPPTVSRQCHNCKHYRGILEDDAPPALDGFLDRGRDDRTDDGEVFACSAFPDGIPEDILEERFDHRNAYEGDDGIRFLPRSRRSAEVVDGLTFGGQG